jgi:hypothetical protein
VSSPGGSRETNQPNDLVAIKAELSEETFGGKCPDLKWKLFSTSSNQMTRLYFAIDDTVSLSSVNRVTILGPLPKHVWEVELGYKWERVPGAMPLAGTGHAWVNMKEVLKVQTNPEVLGAMMWSMKTLLGTLG